MSQHRSRLINSTALVAVVAVFGCQPAVPTATAPGAGAPGARGYDLLAAKAGKEPDKGAKPAAPEPCAPPPFTVYAKNPNALLHMSGTRNTIEGNVRTHDGIKMVGNREVITGDAYYADDITIQGNSNYVAGEKRKTGGAAAWAPPELAALLAKGPRYDFNGDVDLKDAPVWLDQNTLKPGVYYSTGRIVLSKNALKGNVTLIGASVKLPGKNHDLTAYADGVLAYATGYGANALHISGNNNAYQGTFVVPNGEFQLTGGQNTVRGTVWADSFKVSGNNNMVSNSGTTTCPTPVPSPVASPAASPETSPEPSPSPSIVEPPSPSPIVTVPPEPSVAPSVAPSAAGTASPPVETTPSPAPTTSPSGIKSDYTDDEPYDVAATSDGFIFTANYLGSSVTKLTSVGKPVKNIEQQAAMRGIAVAADDTLWVTGVDENHVRHLLPDGTLIGRYAVGESPIHVRIDPQGNIWTANAASSTVTKLSSTGAFLATYGNPVDGIGNFTNAKDIAFDGSGNAWVAGHNAVWRMKLDGTQATKFTVNGLGTVQTEGVTIDRAGNAWVTLELRNAVAKVPSTGGTPSYFTVGERPNGIVTDRNGFVWVANKNGNNVFKLDPTNGTKLAEVLTGGGPMGISVDQQGRILTANLVDKSVSIITP